MARKILNGLDLSNTRIINLADGTASNDAVNLNQLNAAVRGLTWKYPCRAASTANTNVAAPGATMDGVTLSVNDRVLLKDQSTTSANGIYVWTGSAVPLTRAFDADSATELDGATTLVTEGTVNGDRAFTQTASPVAVGTTSLVFVQLGGSGAAYTAGNGLQLSGNAFSVLLDAASGLQVSGTGLKLDNGVAVRKFAATIGTGALTVIPVVHNLGTLDITYSIREVTGGAYVDTDAVATDVNTLTLTFNAAPASNSLRVVIHA